MRQEFRFYVTFLCGFALLMLGFYSPPQGEIADSVIIASGIIISIGALAVGVDIKGIIAELVKLKQVTFQSTPDKQPDERK